MTVNFELLAQLREAGVKQIEFSVNNEVRAVEFFDPRIIAEADVAQVVAKTLTDTPDEILESIRKIEQDENIPEVQRLQLAEQMRSRLYYGSSS